MKEDVVRLVYFPETDSLYIDFVDRPSVESEEIACGVVADFDAEGALVGIDIDSASTMVDLSRLILAGLAEMTETLA